MKKLNKKMYRGAMRSILSELARQGRLLLVDDFNLNSPKTGSFIEKLDALALREALIVTDGISENLYLASRNVPHVNIVDTMEINPFTLIGYENVVMTKEAMQKVEAWLS